jgi:predicted ATPase
LDTVSFVVALPSGTVTFLFTDMEGSTRRWEIDAEAMRTEVARHDGLVQAAVRAHRGAVFAPGGDGFGVAFGRAADALACAVAIQTALPAAGLPGVRIGIHTGEVDERDGNYFGSAVNRAARLMAIGHAGQILVSHATEQLVRPAVAGGMSLVDLGQHRLRDLSSPERVFELRDAGSSVEFPPLRSLDVLRTNLPIQLTSLVGREEDLKRVSELVRLHRVVTLTGVGGVGKTRLAEQVGADLLDDFPDGVWLVELAPVGEDSRVVETVAAAFGVEPVTGKTIEQSLVDALQSQTPLVILDNCEHLLDEVNRLAAVLAREIPRIAVLATSREPLGVPGEHTVALRSLDPQSGVRLFVERATAIDTSFVVADTDVDTLVHLCRRLDGIPLAIELAAARVRMFSPAELASRLDQRFRLLTGARGAVERHQTLRAAIDWSYELLTERDRSVFDRLAVFAGGYTLDAAQVVCLTAEVPDVAVVDALGSLIDKSLLVAEHSELGTRYSQLETIRQYAEEHLLASGDADMVRERHARFYGAFAREAGPGLWSGNEVEWAHRVENDLDNIRAAVSWAVAAGEVDLAMRIAGALVSQAAARPIWATASIAEQALRVPGADQHHWRAMVMGEASWAALRNGDMPTARQLVEDALDAQRAGARFTAPVWSYAMAFVANTAESLPGVLALAAEGLERAEEAGDRAGAIALGATFALNLVVDDRIDDSRRHAERVLADARKLGQPALIAMGLLSLGQALVRSGDHDRGLALLRESAELADAIKSSWQSMGGLTILAASEARYGDLTKAARLMQSALVSASDTGSTFFESGTAHVALTVFNRYGRPDLTARIDGALGFTRAISFGNWRFYYSEGITEARAALGDERYDQLAAEGQHIPVDRILSEIQTHLEAFLRDGPPRPATPR